MSFNEGIQTTPLLNGGLITLDTSQTNNYNSFLYLKPKFGNNYTSNGIFYSFSPYDADQVGLNINKHNSNGGIMNSVQMGIDICNNVYFSSINISNLPPDKVIVNISGCQVQTNYFQNVSGNKPTLAMQANPDTCPDSFQRFMMYGVIYDNTSIPMTFNEYGTANVGILKIPESDYALDVSGQIRAYGNYTPFINEGASIGSDSRIYKRLYLTSNGIQFSTFSSIRTNSVTGNIIFEPSIDISGNTDVNSDLIPSIPNTFNLGASYSRWKNIWLNTINASSSAIISAILNLGGNLNINTNKLQVNASTGNTTIAGTLGVSGVTNLYNNLNVTGNVNVNSSILSINGTTGLVTASNIYPWSTNNELGTSTAIWSNVWTSNVNFGNSVTMSRNVTNDIVITPAANGYTIMSSNLIVNSNVNIGTSNFFVNGANGNACNLGTFDVAGNLQVNSKIKLNASDGVVYTRSNMFAGSNATAPLGTTIGHDGTNGFTYSTYGNYNIGVNSSKNALVIDSTGNAGINTTPIATANLYVKGRTLLNNSFAVGKPSTTDYMGGPGTYLVLYPSGAGNYPYALGIDNLTMWYGTAESGKHVFYNGLNSNIKIDGSDYGATDINMFRNVGEKLQNVDYVNSKLDLRDATSFFLTRPANLTTSDLKVDGINYTGSRIVSLNVYFYALNSPWNFSDLTINGQTINWGIDGPPITMFPNNYTLITFISKQVNVWYGLIANQNME